VFLFWQWPGGSPAGKCFVTCGVIVPFVAGGMCCVAVGLALRWVERMRVARVVSGPHSVDTRMIVTAGETRMDIPILGGIALGTVCASISAPSICGFMCRIYQAPLCVAPCQTILPGLIFASISSFIFFVLAFDAGG
jgi:hypothetical protein